MEADSQEASLMESADGADAPHRDRINVLFLMIQMQMGGSERLVLNLAEGLDRRRFASSVGWFIQPEPLAQFERLSVPLHHVPKLRRFDWEAMAAIRRIVRQHRIDVINAHHFMPMVYAFYAAKVGGKARLVYTEHSEHDVEKATGLWRGLGALLLRFCDAAIGVSPAVSEKLRSHFRMRPDRVVTIENGAVPDTAPATDSERQALRARLGLPPSAVLFGIVANLKRNKNHLFLLQALREVVRSRGDVHVVVVGQAFPEDPDNSEAEIRDYVRDEHLRDVVHLMGYRPDVRDVLRALDVFCLVSHREGLPISLVEAMSAGLPVIGTDIEGIRGIIAPGVNGYTVTPGDIAGLATALDQLAGEPALRRRMGEASRLIVLDRYSLARCVDRTAELFASLVGERGTSNLD
jgi:L-malate glycosyltransferase